MTSSCDERGRVVGITRILVIGGLFVGNACAQRSPYDRLCRLYEDQRGRASTPELAMALARRVEDEIPEIAADYAFLANVNIGDRYEVLKALARDKAKQPDWHCDEIRRSYPPGSKH